MGAAPIYVAANKTQGQTFVNADGATVKDVFTASALGARLTSLQVATDETAARILRLYIRYAGAGADFLLGSKTIPIGAGTGGVVAVNMLDPGQLMCIELDGSIILGPNDVIRASMEVAVTAAKTEWVTAFGGTY